MTGGTAVEDVSEHVLRTVFGEFYFSEDIPRLAHESHSWRKVLPSGSKQNVLFRPEIG